MHVLTGYKTYILSGCAALTTFCYLLDWIDAKTWAAILSLLGFGTQVTQRIAVQEVKKQL